MSIAESLNVHDKEEFLQAVKEIPPDGRKNLLNCYLLEDLFMIGTAKKLFIFHFTGIPESVYKPWIVECKAQLESITTNKVLWKVDPGTIQKDKVF